MLRTYVYYEDKANWLEETHLLFHDLCAILDEEENTVYLWNGPKSTNKRLEKGYESINDLFGGFPDPEFINSLTIIILEEEFIPPEIQTRLDKMLEGIKKDEEEDKYVFTSLLDMRLYFVLSIAVIFISALALLIITLTPASWETFSDLPGYYGVTNTDYDAWLILTGALIIASLVICFVNFLIGIIEREIQVSSFALMGIAIFIGLISYYTQGPFLFLFHDNSTEIAYLIPMNQLLMFTLLNLIAYLIFLLPAVYKFVKFSRNYRDYIY